MNAAPFNIPAGISHDRDLSLLSPDERRKHHVRALRDIRFNEGPAAVRAYQARYPETANYRARSNVTVSVPKPAGYPAAIRSLVAGWLTSDDALRKSNKADVAALNATFGGERFNPANFLNRPIDRATRANVAELFRQRGFRLPDTADTLAKAKQAAKAARAASLPDATAFGTIGTLAGNRLTIGGKAFRIIDRHGHKSVRFYRNGGEAQLRLDLLTDFLEQCGLLDRPEENPLPPSCKEEGETVARPVRGVTRLSETVADAPSFQPKQSASPALLGETVADEGDATPPSLSERIKRLTAYGRQQVTLPIDEGLDPLALIELPASHSAA